ncbi:MAG: cysteine-rich CWC family protein [Ottowia sp.]|nr:cysteine-rich CWC family protein [Ottowia sp.]MCB2033935.1 cysteine-rich CWC family protein [Ottowia sp.]MCB2070899.1 cysteine-rich CWC family protein [Ottowia sp.]MCP5256463.1 cysteine-rich CWC family protein [Burkholderiaceae bacterium]
MILALRQSFQCQPTAGWRHSKQNTTVPADPWAPPDPTRCPLCGQPNTCAMELEKATGQPQPPCWCTRATFDPAALAAIPAEARGLACLCSACAAGGGVRQRLS